MKFLYKNRLETFLQVADAGSFSKAAERLYISPTAVIKKINLLEFELKLTLFTRTHRGVFLTPSGQSLYDDAKYIIQYTNDSITRAQNAVNEKENIVRIGTSIMTPSDFLVDLWSKTHVHCPEIKFELVHFENTPHNAREILKNLGRDIDIVPGVFDKSLLKERQCTALELSRSPVCCTVSINHRLANRASIDIEDLFGETLMIIQKGWISHIDELRDDISQNYPQIKIVDFNFYNLAVFNQCENSNNIILSIEQWSSVHPLLKVIPIKWKYQIPFGILYSPNPSRKVRSFINAVAKVFEITT